MDWTRAFYLFLSFLVHMLAASPAGSDRCRAGAISSPKVFGTEIISVSAASVQNISASLPQIDPHPAIDIVGLNFCNVSVQYTHPGQNDTINVQIWLPSQWNGRFMGTGGGGYTTGFAPDNTIYPASLGYATVVTDGGHFGDADGLSPASWALSSPGNVDWIALQDFAAVALDDAASIGKAVAKSYYGKSPEYSYFNGCSTGGRQGLMLAQRYPTQYNGILASAPAINWDRALPGAYWPQLMLDTLGPFRSQCELGAFTAAAIEACDDLDGVSDGIITSPDCHFDPSTLVGQNIICPGGSNVAISPQAAEAVNAVWTGARNVDGKFLWHGWSKDVNLTSILNATCSTDECTGGLYTLASNWINYFVEEDPTFDVRNISRRGYDHIFRQSRNIYQSIIGTDDPDLTEFRQAKGKMITWHGLADDYIPPNGTYQYYDQVLELDPKAADFYRFFPAPGVAHCMGGVGYFPETALQSLTAWVEKGFAPETLEGTTLPDANGTVRKQPLCPYPLVTGYKGGDQNATSSFECRSSFD